MISIKLNLEQAWVVIQYPYSIPYLVAKFCISCLLDSTHDYQDKISSLQFHVCTQNNQRCHLGQQSYKIQDTLERKKGESNSKYIRFCVRKYNTYNEYTVLVLVFKISFPHSFVFPFVFYFLFPFLLELLFFAFLEILAFTVNQRFKKMWYNVLWYQGAKKIIFTACPSGKLS